MAATATMYTGTFRGRPDQVRQVRAAVARYLDGCPVAEDAVLAVSEIASNSVLHSQSSGGLFTVRCELTVNAKGGAAGPGDRYLRLPAEYGTGRSASPCRG